MSAPMPAESSVTLIDCNGVLLTFSETSDTFTADSDGVSRRCGVSVIHSVCALSCVEWVEMVLLAVQVRAVVVWWWNVGRSLGEGATRVSDNSAQRQWPMHGSRYPTVHHPDLPAATLRSHSELTSHSRPLAVVLRQLQC